MLVSCVLFTCIAAATGSAAMEACNATDESVLIQNRLALGDAAPNRQRLDKAFQEYAVSLEDIDNIKASFASGTAAATSLDQLTDFGVAQECFDAHSWLEKFSEEKSWKKYSQGDQDAVLTSLFSDKHLGTTNKQFVEFGFPDHSFSASYGNGRYLKEVLGFNSYLLLDGSISNAEINLHKEFVTASNIVDIFDKFKVPPEADYVSVDIDSCDLWVFSAMTKKYRPRVVTVEYNANYHMDDYTTLRCTNPTSEDAYYFRHDNIYGASLSAIDLAAQRRGYSLVYVTPGLDAFFVRNDLLCRGTAVPKARFAATASKKMWHKYNDTFGPKSEVTLNFKEWLAAHSDH